MKKLFPLLFLLVVVGVFFHPFLSQGKLPIPADTIIGLYHPFRDLYAAEYPRGIPFKNFLITDPVRQQYPFRELAVSLEKKGQLPLWNPYNMAGTPLLATLQSAALYPLNIFFFVLPFPLAWSLLIFLQPLLAGIFLYWYLQNLKLHHLASLLGGITYAFCGFSIAWLEWGTVGHVGLWLPLLLLSVDKIFKALSLGTTKGSVAISKEKGFLHRITSHNHTMVWYFVFILSLISSFFAGHLQTFFYLYVVVTVYFGVRWFQFGKQKKPFFLFLLLNSCFLLLAAIQWLPTLQFIQSSARDIDQLDWHKEGWFLPWQHLTQFIVPDFFGNPTTLNYWGIWNYAEFVGYVGIFPLLMALLAVFIRHDKKTLFFGLLFLLALIFALPTVVAHLPYILHIPFIATSQPTRLLFIADFSLAVLASLGFDLILRQKIKSKMIYPVIFVSLIFVGLWIFVIAGQKIMPQISAENFFITKRNLYFPSFIFLSLIPIVLIKAFFRGKKLDILLIFLFFVITFFDLLRFSNKFIPFVNPEYLFPQTKALAFLQADKDLYRIMSTSSEILPPNFSIMYRLQTVDGYDPLYLRRYGELVAAMERGEPNINPPFGFNRIITPQGINSRLINLIGVKYILSLSEINNSQFEEVFSEGKTKIYRNKQVFPRAFFVTEIKVAKDKEQAINMLFDKSVNLQQTAIVEGWDKTEKKTFSLGEVKINTYSENEIRINTSNSEEGYMVFIDTFYPTWKAKICDGKGASCQNTKIYLTDYHFRGIVIPEGKHTVIFSNSLL